MEIKTTYVLTDSEVSILSAYLRLSLEAGVIFKNTALENMTISNLCAQFTENASEAYFERLMED